MEKELRKLQNSYSETCLNKLKENLFLHIPTHTLLSSNESLHTKEGEVDVYKADSLFCGGTIYGTLPRESQWVPH